MIAATIPQVISVILIIGFHGLKNIISKFHKPIRLEFTMSLDEEQANALSLTGVIEAFLLNLF
jgi:hypothetical protein